MLRADREDLIELQAVPADASGAPDLAAVFPGPGAWATDADLLDAAAQNRSFAFLRARVTFRLTAGGAPLTLPGPRPAIDFLRLPSFRF